MDLIGRRDVVGAQPLTFSGGYARKVCSGRDKTSEYRFPVTFSCQHSGENHLLFGES